MELAPLIRSILRGPDDVIGTETVQIGPRQTVVVDLRTAQRHRGEFARAASRIPQIEDGLSYRLIKPYTANNGQLAQAFIAIGQVLDLWRVFPDPAQCPDLYNVKGTMYPSSGAIDEWPS